MIAHCGTGVVKSGTEQMGHVWLFVEKVKEWFFSNMVQIHLYNYINK